MTPHQHDIARQVVLCQAELCCRILPHLEVVVQKACGADLTASKPEWVVRALLEDAVTALALGYRYSKKTRHALIEGLEEVPSPETKDLKPDTKDKGEKRNAGDSLPAGRIFQSTILHRAIVYVEFTGFVMRKLGHDPCAARAEEILAHLKSVAPDRYNTIDQLLRFVESQVPPFKTDVDAEALEALHQALDDGGRIYVDRELNGALWLLDHPPVFNRSKRGGKLRSLVLSYVRAKLEGMPDSLVDPAVALWGLLRLREFGPVEDTFAGRVLARVKEKGAFPGAGHATDLETAPELFEDAWRSDAFAVANLVELRRLFPALQGSVDDLIQESVARLLDTRHAPPPRNLHFLAQRLLAFETLSPRAAHHQASHAIHSVVCDATEINVGDYRRIEDYLIWRDDPLKAEALEISVEKLQQKIATYRGNKTARPLNILLWAAPGSGKSFLIKQIVARLGMSESYVEVNAAQLTRPDDLVHGFRRVTSRIADKGSAVFFLDEADTPLPGHGAEYLFPYLLMPMWDGEYLSDGHPLNMKRLVWFFAVSKKRSIDEFREWAMESQSNKTPNLNESVDDDEKAPAKGRDFISRIHAEISLPELDNRGQLLVFLGNMVRIHGKSVKIERGILHRLATHTVSGGARAIEKAVMLVPMRGGVARTSDVVELLNLDRGTTATTLQGWQEEFVTELVGLIDF